MALSAEEKKQLKALQQKEKEIDRPAGGVNFNLDLSDDKAYDRAVKLGLISEPGDNGDDDGDDDADDADDAPRRRSYFGE
jgi:hypothetical protein